MKVVKVDFGRVLVQANGGEFDGIGLIPFVSKEASITVKWRFPGKQKWLTLFPKPHLDDRITIIGVAPARDERIIGRVYDLVTLRSRDGKGIFESLFIAFDQIRVEAVRRSMVEHGEGETCDCGEVTIKKRSMIEHGKGGRGCVLMWRDSKGISKEWDPACRECMELERLNVKL